MAPCLWVLKPLKGEVNPVTCGLPVGGGGVGVHRYWRWGSWRLHECILALGRGYSGRPLAWGIAQDYIYVACILAGRLCSLLYKVVLIGNRSE
jgi:hypothetical protein